MEFMPGKQVGMSEKCWPDRLIGELRELISLLENALGKKAQIDRQPTQPGDVPQTFADIAKARRLLNYNPRTQIEAGISLFIDWFIKRKS